MVVPPLETEELPAAARPVDPAELSGDFACGPFSTRQLESESRPLLEDRLRLRFLPGARHEGDAAAGRIELSREGEQLFVGARETFTRGDDQFDRRATKAATFGGTYDPVTLSGGAGGGHVPIVTGLVRDLPSDREMVALAHGWFLDDNRDVLDVAVFVTRAAAGDVPNCRRLAEKILLTVTRGPRLLTRGSDADETREVSYARFRYRPGSEWSVSGSEGIHDFARIHFRRRGTFPRDGVNLQMGLDAHPGDWASPGTEEGRRAGTVLGLPVTWRLTKESAPPQRFGAWTVSGTTLGHDRVVASLWAHSAEERAEGMRFAEALLLVR